MVIDATVSPSTYLNTNLIGNSESITRIRNHILQIAPTGLPVLISGESGTGKEIVARCIHACSRRSVKPLIAINCGGLSPSLIESELFGHSQGAFTGADKTKHGYFEAAEKGTLFLDEIGELSNELQCKFLRVLDSGEFKRLGDTVQRKADVRIISATNKDLFDMVKKKRFRKDLLYRLKGASIHMPPLRERIDDIPLLIRHILGTAWSIDQAALNILITYDWPGNVREMIMMLQTITSKCQRYYITEDVVYEVLAYEQSEKSATIIPFHDAKKRLLHEFETDYFIKLINTTHGNLSKAAVLAHLDRKHLREKLKFLGLYPPSHMRIS